MNSHNELEIEIDQMIKILKDNNGTLEMEVRIGEYDSNLNFHAGYPSDYRMVPGRLINRLKNNVNISNSNNDSKWSMENERMYIKSYYNYKGVTIIRTSIPNETDKFIIKQRKKIIDVKTNRPRDLRFSLNEEVPVIVKKEIDNEMYNLIHKEPPNFVSVVARISFFETIKILDNNVIIFRYDISKVSDGDKTKIDSVKKPCSYHCEIEIMNPIPKSPNPEIETQLNHLIRNLFLDRAKAMLGTHLKTQNGTIQLETPKLLIVNKK
jgi:hypothetical protein